MKRDDAIQLIEDYFGNSKQFSKYFRIHLSQINRFWQHKTEIGFAVTYEYTSENISMEMSEREHDLLNILKGKLFLLIRFLIPIASKFSLLFPQFLSNFLPIEIFQFSILYIKRNNAIFI